MDQIKDYAIVSLNLKELQNDDERVAGTNEEGDQVVTSKIVSKKGNVITTENGSTYELVDPKKGYENWKLKRDAILSGPKLKNRATVEFGAGLLDSIKEEIADEI